MVPKNNTASPISFYFPTPLTPLDTLTARQTHTEKKTCFRPRAAGNKNVIKHSRLSFDVDDTCDTTTIATQPSFINSSVFHNLKFKLYLLCHRSVALLL